MISIAIDGPAGVGKSTVSKTVAEKLGFVYVDTGAFYRAIALYAIKNNVSSDDIKFHLHKINITLKLINGDQKIYLNGEDVCNKIRTEEVSNMASKVSSVVEVRAFLLKLQKSLAVNNDVVMDGRDIGTVVLPNATVKIFLTAKAEIRACRRFKELLERKVNVDYDSVLKDITQRDLQDTTRKIAPLKAAADAIVVDNGEYDLNQSINEVYDAICKELERKQIIKDETK